MFKIKRHFIIPLLACTFACNSIEAIPAFRPMEKKESVKDSVNEPALAVFTPPDGWSHADKQYLTEHVKILVIGPKLKNDMPPTMNLMIEPFQGPLKDYLKNVKRINDSHGDSWKDLGLIKTKAGDASLSQVEVSSKWGGEKLMHAIIVKNGYAYVLTATASKNEFARLYQQFYTAFKSFQITDDLFAIIKDKAKQKQIEDSFLNLKSSFNNLVLASQNKDFKETIFLSPDFQNGYWKPFEDMLKTNYSDFGNEWVTAVLDEMHERLISD